MSKVTINGRIFARKELLAAITTKVPTRRLNAIMRALWSTEELLKLCLKKNITSPPEYREMTDEEVDTIVGKLQKTTFNNKSC